MGPGRATCPQLVLHGFLNCASFADCSTAGCCSGAWKRVLWVRSTPLDFQDPRHLSRCLGVLYLVGDPWLEGEEEDRGTHPETLE